MRIAAFCTMTGYQSVAQATGVQPMTFPPMTMEKFDPHSLEGVDLLYFHLHGIPGQPYWYGDGFATAISVEQIGMTRLADCIAFVANCYGQDSRMTQALIDAGAKAVISGPGSNYTVKGQVRGADLLGQHFIAALTQGYDPAAALEYSKAKIQLRALFSGIERDALGFTLVQGITIP